MDTAFQDDSADTVGAPTVPAPDEVTLATVFDGNPPRTAPKPEPKEDELTIEHSGDDGVSFDEFYGAEPVELPQDTSDGESASQGDDEADDDFKQWLEGLKT